MLKSPFTPPTDYNCPNIPHKFSPPNIDIGFIICIGLPSCDWELFELGVEVVGLEVDFLVVGDFDIISLNGFCGRKVEETLTGGLLWAGWDCAYCACGDLAVKWTVIPVYSHNLTKVYHPKAGYLQK